MFLTSLSWFVGKEGSTIAGLPTASVGFELEEDGDEMMEDVAPAPGDRFSLTLTALLSISEGQIPVFDSFDNGEITLEFINSVRPQVVVKRRLGRIAVVLSRGGV